jgi:hypothetical protein
LLTGAAGTGKTRLARELCARMANRGWLSAFIAEAATEDTIARVMQLEQPALLVVDCAETRLNLGQLLEPLASSDGAAPMPSTSWRTASGSVTSVRCVCQGASTARRETPCTRCVFCY